MQVSIQIPLDKSEIENILKNPIQQDLSITVAPEFKDMLDDKFSQINEADDNSRRLERKDEPN